MEMDGSLCNCFYGNTFPDHSPTVGIVCVCVCVPYAVRTCTQLLGQGRQPLS